MLSTPSLARNIPLLKWYNFLGSLCFYAAIMLIYYVEVTHSYALAASVFSVTMLAATFFEIPTGVLSDWFGRKGVLILSASCGLLSLVFFAFASGYWMLVIGAVLDGLAYALQSGNNDALLHDSLKELGREEEYTARQGEIGFWNQIAISVAVLAGSVVVGVSLSLVFQLSLIPFAIALLLTFFVQEPTVRGSVKGNVYAHIGEAIVIIRDNPRLRLLAVAQAFKGAFWGAKAPLMPAFFLTLWPLWAIGIARALSHAFSAFGMKASGYFTKKYGKEKIALWGEGAMFSVGTFILAVPSFFSPLLNSVSIFFNGLASPAESAMLQREYTDSHRATLGSLSSFVGTLLGAALAFFIGLYADYAGLLPALLLLQVFFLPVIFVYWKVGRPTRGA